MKSFYEKAFSYFQLWPCTLHTHTHTRVWTTTALKLNTPALLMFYRCKKLLCSERNSRAVSSHTGRKHQSGLSLLSDSLQLSFLLILSALLHLHPNQSVGQVVGIPVEFQFNTLHLIKARESEREKRQKDERKEREQDGKRLWIRLYFFWLGNQHIWSCFLLLSLFLHTLLSISPSLSAPSLLLWLHKTSSQQGNSKLLLSAPRENLRTAWVSLKSRAAATQLFND